MTVFRRAIALAIAIALPVGLQLPAAAGEESGQTLTIGVDNNQSATTHPFFSYTDFFTRSVAIHSGDTLRFRVDYTFHVLALAHSESAARTNFPLFMPDEEAAAGTGGPRIELGPAFAIAAPGAPAPSCGTAGTPCRYHGGNPGLTPDAEVVEAALAGGQDWFVQVDAPVGTYTYFCYIHPGMTGKLKVVGSDRPTTTQSWIDTQSVAQFARDQNDALKAEAEASKVRFTGDEPGSRTYIVHAGVNTRGNHVSIIEMLPAHLNLVQGDRVKFVMQSNEAHSFTFPRSHDEPPFGPDCTPPDVLLAAPGPGAPPTCGDPGSSRGEFVVDPGVSPSGTALTDPAALIDSGLLLGGGNHGPGPTTWTLTTNANTVATNGYSYHCVLHDFMAGSLDVAAAPVDDDDGGDRRSASRHS